MYPEMGTKVIKDVHRIAGIARNVRFCQLRIESGCLAYLRSLNVIRVCINPVRKKEDLWTYLSNHGSNLFAYFYAVHEVAIGKIKHRSAFYSKQGSRLLPFFLSDFRTSVRCRFTIGQIKDVNIISKQNQFQNAASHTAFYIIGVWAYSKNGCHIKTFIAELLKK